MVLNPKEKKTSTTSNKCWWSFSFSISSSTTRSLTSSQPMFRRSLHIKSNLLQSTTRLGSLQKRNSTVKRSSVQLLRRNCCCPIASALHRPHSSLYSTHSSQLMASNNRRTADANSVDSSHNYERTFSGNTIVTV